MVRIPAQPDHILSAIFLFLLVYVILTCLGYMVPGGCVFNFKSANVLVRKYYIRFFLGIICVRVVIE